MQHMKRDIKKSKIQNEISHSQPSNSSSLSFFFLFFGYLTLLFLFFSSPFFSLSAELLSLYLQNKTVEPLFFFSAHGFYSQLIA